MVKSEDALPKLPRRAADSYKNTFGHALLVGGFDRFRRLDQSLGNGGIALRRRPGHRGHSAPARGLWRGSSHRT